MVNRLQKKNIFDGRATLCGLENQLRGEKMSVLDDTGSCHMFSHDNLPSGYLT